MARGLRRQRESQSERIPKPLMVDAIPGYQILKTPKEPSPSHTKSNYDHGFASQAVFLVLIDICHI